MSQHLSKAKQQLVCLEKTSMFGLEGCVECVTGVAELIAALHDESHGVVVTS